MIYLMRHGETLWNLEHRLQGLGDSALTPKGRLQAAAYGERLRNETLDLDGLRVVSSPLGRARHTAEIVLAGLGLSAERIETDERLREFTFGSWEGMTWHEIRRNDREAFEKRQADKWNVRAPGGECFKDIARRAEDWLAGIGEEDLVLAFSHGATGRVIRGLYAGLSPQATMAQSEPQDRVYKLAGGSIEELLAHGA